MSPTKTIVSKLHPRDLFDMLVRVTLGLLFAFAAGKCIRSGIATWPSFDLDRLPARQLAKALSMLAIGFYTLMLACLYAVRLRAINRAAGVWPTIAALLGGFMMVGLMFLAPNENLPLGVQLTGSALVTIGNLFMIVIILRLGKSFSILPESRKLVTGGLYKYVRHPLYMAEAIVTLGIMIHFLSLWAVLLVVVQFSMQLVRMHYEEKVLSQTFPDYSTYAKRTWRVIPGVY